MGKKWMKMALVINLKLVFIDWFFYNLIILIKLCKIWYLHLDKALLFPRNQVIYLKNWKLWRAPTTIKFTTFCGNFAHVSYLTMPTKRCSGFFLFCLGLELLIKMRRNQVFFIFANNSRPKQNKKTLEHPFVDIGK